MMLAFSHEDAMVVTNAWTVTQNGVMGITVHYVKEWGQSTTQRKVIMIPMQDFCDRLMKISARRQMQMLDLREFG